MKSIIIIVVCYLIVAGYLSAFAGTYDTSQKDDNDSGCRFCFSGSASGRCVYFFVIRAGVYANMSSSRGDVFPLNKFPPGTILVNDFGILVKYRSKNAFGVSFTLISTDESSKYGLRFRYRRWLANKTSLNFSSGVIFQGPESWQHHNDRGFVTSVSLDYNNMIAIELIYENIGYDYTDLDYTSGDMPPPNFTSHYSTSSFYLGASGNSYLALIILALWGISYLGSAASNY